MNLRDKVLLMAIIGLVTVLASVLSYPHDTPESQLPAQDNHGQHGHHWGGHGRGGGCKHKSGDGHWHHHSHEGGHGHGGGWHHHPDGGNRDGGWHHHHEGGKPEGGWQHHEHHGEPGHQGGHPEGKPSFPLSNNGPQPQRPITVPVQPDRGYIAPTTAAPGHQLNNQHSELDDTISNIFNTNTANRVDDTEQPIRPLIDVRGNEPSKPAGVPSISDLVLAGDFSKIK